MKKQLKFINVSDVANFVNIGLGVPFDITAGKGRYVVDGKSLMGILSLNLSDPVTIEYDENDSRCTEEIESAFLEKIKNYII